VSEQEPGKDLVASGEGPADDPVSPAVVDRQNDVVVRDVRQEDVESLRWHLAVRGKLRDVVEPRHPVAGPDGSAHPEVAFVMGHPDVEVAAGPLVSQLSGPVGRAVVHYNYLPVGQPLQALQIAGRGVQDGREIVFLVVCHHDYGKADQMVHSPSLRDCHLLCL